MALIFLSDYKGPGLGRENAFSGHSTVFHLGNRGFRNKSIVYLLECSKYFNLQGLLPGDSAQLPEIKAHRGNHCLLSLLYPPPQGQDVQHWRRKDRVPVTPLAE